MADDATRRPSLDDAIDRAVRSLMRADMEPEFERRVMRCLEKPARQPYAWAPLATAAAALAAIVVLAIVVSHPWSRPHPRTAPTAAPQSEPAVAARAPVPSPRPSRVPTAAPERPSLAQGITTKPQARRTTVNDTVSAASVETTSVNEPPIHVIAALAPPDALAVEEIEQHTMHLPGISVPTIDVGQLNIEPLQAPYERAKE